MIARLEGVVLEKSPTRVVLDVHGVGYDVLIPVSTYEKLAEVGERARLLTYLHVREDLLQLFGFSTEEEKTMFSHLISISGVGPKLALGVLSGASVAALKQYIAQGDLQALTRLPGLGRKTAQRLVTELKDRFAEFEPGPTEVAPQLGSPAEVQKFEEASLALVALGFNKGAAQAEVSRILRQEPDLPVDELVRRVLQKS